MGRTDLRCTILCAATVLAACLVVNPFVNFPFNDDWSYAFTVHKLLQTGHIVYNGWSSPFVITQVLWGAAWAKMFGFSFITLRLCMLPFAIGSSVLCYLIARLSGLRPAPAVFVALLLGLSPIFLPLATSFMTDVMGLFFMLLSIYALAKAVLTRRMRWLGIAVIAAIVGGMSRQVVWIVPLVIIPYLLWIGRKDRRFCAAAASGCILVLIDVIATQSWFATQHDVVIDPSMMSSLRSAMSDPWPGLDAVGRLILTLFLLTLPLGASVVILAGNSCRKRIRLFVCGVIVGVALALDVCVHPYLLLWPWSVNVVWPDGILIRHELSGQPPTAMAPWFVTTWSVLVFIALGASLAPLLDFAARWRNLSAVAKRIISPTNHEVTPIILAIVGVAYLAILSVRSEFMPCFDRYTLPLIPIIAIFTLLYLRRSFPDSSIRRVAFAICAVLLASYTAFSLAATHDLLALARARVDAIKTLRDAGVAPTAIAAGFEYDCWTQLEATGTVNSLRALNHTQRIKPRLGLTPAVWPLYRVEYTHLADTHASGFPPVCFTSWLPPFHREIYIDKFFNPWWLKRPPADRTSPEPGIVDFEEFN